MLERTRDGRELPRSAIEDDVRIERLAQHAVARASLGAGDVPPDAERLQPVEHIAHVRTLAARQSGRAVPLVQSVP